MLTLFRNELRKILPYRTVWVILGIFVILLFLLVKGSSSITINGETAGARLYKFPDIWEKLSYVASYFNLLLGILLIILITDEYAFRTLRQQVIDGYFRSDVIASKVLVMLSIAVFSAVFVGLLGLGFGLYYGKAGQQVSGASALVYYFVQALGYLSIAMFFAFLIRKNGLAIISFLIFTKVLEPISRYPVDDSIDQYFPMKALGSLTPMPSRDIFNSMAGVTIELEPQQAMLPAVLYILLFTGLSYLLLKARDL